MYNEIICFIFASAEKRQLMEKRQNDDIFMIFERGFFSNPPKNVMTMGLLQRSTFCPCFKLIAVIDCASKMMMSCVLVILLSFQFVVAFCLNLFVSSKNNRRVFGFSFAFFLPFWRYSQLLNKKLILFYFWFWFCYVFSIVFQTFKNLNQQIIWFVHVLMPICYR